MSLSRKKAEKLAEIARLYYKEDKGQSEIAESFGISSRRLLRDEKMSFFLYGGWSYYI